MYHVLETSCVTDTGLSKSAARPRPRSHPRGPATGRRATPAPESAGGAPRPVKQGGGDRDRIPEPVRVNNRRPRAAPGPAIIRTVLRSIEKTAPTSWTREGSRREPPRLRAVPITWRHP
jgi:hypothetical protein